VGIIVAGVIILVTGWQGVDLLVSVLIAVTACSASTRWTRAVTARWTWVALGLVVLTLLVAATGMTPHVGGLDIQFTGRLRAWVYVAWVALFSTLAGLLYGAWVDGSSAWLILAYLAAFVGVLALSLSLVGRRNRRAMVSAETH